MTLAVNWMRILILAAMVTFAAILITTLRGGASAQTGPQGTFGSFDRCGQVAVLNMVMTAGFEHQQDIGMPATVLTEIKCLIEGLDAEPSALIPMRLEGNPPWVEVEGEFIFNGDYMAEGTGTVAGTPNVRVVLDSHVNLDYEITGTYTMGADGELGTAAVYAITGTFGTDDVPTPTQPGQTPDPAPTATPAGEPVAWGDHNCSDAADPVDSLLNLRHDAGLSTITNECPPMGQVVEVVQASPHPWGDVDCSGTPDPIDSLKILRYDAGLNVNQPEGCPEIGSQIEIEGLQQ